MSGRGETEEPGGRQPAPGELGIAQAFLNSVDLEDGIEQFDTPESLAGWLAGRGLLPPDARLDEADLARVIAAREALRDLLAAHSGEEVAPDAPRRLRDAIGGATLIPRIERDGRVALDPAGAGVDLALGRLMTIVYRASVDGSWQRLKTCRNDACRWAFYDASKNRSGVWCTMAICGAQRKARAYRRRQARRSRG